MSGLLKPNAAGELSQRTGMENCAIKKQILVVDDVPAICSLLADCLEAGGYKVRVATSAHDACTLLLETRFSLVITDLYLEDRQSLAGLEVINHARNTQPLTPVIVISGSFSMQIAVQLARFRLEAFMEKPLSLEKLLRVTSELIARG